MACIYCNEQDETRLAMRSEVINGKFETFQICITCLGKKLIGEEIENGNSLPEQKLPESGNI